MMIVHTNTFRKEERLKGFKTMDELFSKGKSMVNYPLKVIFLKKNQNPSSLPRAAFSVSKKNFKKAVDRNLLKRRMREAYRLNKNHFCQSLNGQSYDLIFIYISKEILPYQDIENSLKKILSRLAK